MQAQKQATQSNTTCRSENERLTLSTSATCSTWTKARTRSIYLAGSSIRSQRTSLWNLVHVFRWRDLVDALSLWALVGWRHLVHPLRCEWPLLEGMTLWWGGGCRRLAIEHRSDKQFEAVAGCDALTTVERTQPPSLQPASVLLNDSQDVALPECQLFRGFRNVVIKRFSHQVL